MMFGLENLFDKKNTCIPTFIVRCLADICPGAYVDIYPSWFSPLVMLLFFQNTASLHQY